MKKYILAALAAALWCIPAYADWEVQPGELAVILLCGFIVGACGLLWRVVTAKHDLDPIVLDLCSPSAANARNSLKTTGIVSRFPSISLILCARRLPQIYAAIVERISVYMIRAFSRPRSRNNGMHKNGFSAQVPLRIELPASRVLPGVPVRLRQCLKIRGVHDGDVAIGKCDEANRWISWLNNFRPRLNISRHVAHFTVFGCLALLILSTGNVYAQNPTAVTGTILDPSSVPYFPAQVTACLTPNTLDPTVGGKHVNNNIGTNYCIGSVPTAGDGSFSMPLFANANITPAATQWVFTVQTVGAAPPAGKGSQSFTTAAVTISGSSQSVTSSFTGLPALLNSSSSSSSPSSAYTFYPVSGTSCAAQNYSPSGTFYCAFPGLPNGNATYSGSDFAVVFNSVTTLLATVGGKLSWRIGVYNINSLTNDATTGCSNFEGSGKQVSYALAFPANTVATSVQWLLEGEAMPVWQGEALTATVNTSGTIFNVTATGVSSVTANNILAGFWPRPVTNCTLSASNSSNEVHYKNMAFRFPVNTRGNEIAFASYFAEAIEYDNVTADFGVSYNTLATGAAPTKGSYGSFGITTTVSSASNYQDFQNVFVSGYDICYDIQSEHLTGKTLTAIYCNFAGEFGRSGTAVFHPNWAVHFVDQENGAGFIWGPQMIQASATDVYFDFEFGNDANWYTTARAKTAKLTETNCNIGTGIIRYGVVVQNQGSVAEVPGANLFTTCGQNFDFQEVAQPLNYARVAALDTFTRPNSSSLGPAWAVIATGAACNMAIASNAATSGAGSLCAWISQATNADQFSKATVNTIDATGMAVIIRASLAANTYNDYVCTSTTGQLLRKRVAGTFTTIATNATNCAVADVMELRAVGTNYFAYRNGVQSMTATDASVTTGFPGIAVGAVTDSATNWSGGSLPLYDQTRSQASQPFFASTYFTQTNCSSSAGTCGSASSGAVSIAAAATTVTVATTAVNLNSDIQLQRNDSLGTRLSVTCNTATAAGDIKVSTITAGVSFVITVQNAPAANPLCLTYSITN